MKKVLLLLVIILSFNSLSFATEELPNWQNQPSVKEVETNGKIEHSELDELYARYHQEKERKYMKYYNVDKLTFTFKPLPKEQIKNLSKEEKEYYKKVLKIEEKIKKGKIRKELEKNPDFLPLEVANYKRSLKYYEKYKNEQYIKDALEQLIKIRSKHLYTNIIDIEVLDFSIGYIACLANSYEYIVFGIERKYKNEKINQKLKNDSWYFDARLADAHFNLGNYRKAIYYKKRIIGEFNNNWAVEHIVFFATCYYYLQDYKNLLFYTKKWHEKEPNFVNSYNLGVFEKNSIISTLYFEEAKNLATNDNEYYKANAKIIWLNQEKIKKAIKNNGITYREPDFYEILENCPYGNKNYWETRQDRFYKNTDFCIANYRGKALAKCFDKVKEEEKQKTYLKINEANKIEENYYKRMQIYAIQDISNEVNYLNRTIKNLAY